MSSATSFPNMPPVPLPSGGLMPVASSATSRTAPPEQRRTVSPQRFYTPPGLLQGVTPVGAVPGTYAMVAERGHAVREQRCDVGNVVIVDSVVAGVGASTLAAILARAPSTARRCCGSCQSGMACHCCPAILGKPKIRNPGKCRRAFARYRRYEAQSS